MTQPDPIAGPIEAAVHGLLTKQAPARAIVVVLLRVAATLYKNGARAQGNEPDKETWMNVAHYALTGKLMSGEEPPVPEEVGEELSEEDQAILEGESEPEPEPKPAPRKRARKKKPVKKKAASKPAPSEEPPPTEVVEESASQPPGE